MWEQPSKAFPENKRYSKEDKNYDKVKLGPSNFTKIRGSLEEFC